MVRPPLRCFIRGALREINYAGACGKTSLLCCFALGEFPKEYVSPVFAAILCSNGLGVATE